MNQYDKMRKKEEVYKVAMKVVPILMKYPEYSKFVKKNMQYVCYALKV